jgi:hypothetical protein
MVDAALGRITGWLSARQVLSLLLPALAFWGAVTLLVVHRVGWSTTQGWWTGIDGQSKAVLTAAAGGGLLVFTLLLAQLLVPLTRLYEGYWRLGRLGRWLARRGEASQRRKWEQLDESTDPAAYRRRYQWFPVSRDQVMPTRLGNVLRAAEAYAGDPRRYGVDAVFFWPRLYPLLSEPLRTELGAARAVVDRMLVTATLSLVLAIGTALAGGAAQISGLARATIVLGALAVSRLAYVGAVWTAVHYAELIRSSFDTHRRDLLRAMGLSPPESLAEERKLWEALGQQLYRRATNQETLLRFRS